MFNKRFHTRWWPGRSIIPADVNVVILDHQCDRHLFRIIYRQGGWRINFKDEQNVILVRESKTRIQG